MTRINRLSYASLMLAAGAISIATSAGAQQVINNDLVVKGSLCVGIDCPNNPAFGFDTIRLQENNLRIHFQDTSNSASFPTNDWRITINESTNGGQEKFSIDDATNSRIPFTIEANAATNSLYVDSTSRIGLKTNTPAVELHIRDGDTPTVRLEQDGSSGFTAQTWDVAGNEANFFVRDVTGGSRLPLKIKPGADTSAIFVAANDRIGLSTESPDASLEVRADAGSIGAGNVVLKLTNPATNGPVTLQLASADTGTQMWNMVSSGNTNNFLISRADTGVSEFLLNSLGNLTITGTLTTGGPTCGGGCDAVFDPALYTVPSIEEHAALMWENGYLPAVGPTGPDAPINLTEHIGRMLNELEHAHIYIEQLSERIKLLEQHLADKG